MLRRHRAIVVLVLSGSIVIAGCARRPEMLQAEAPPPTGAAVVPAPSAVAPEPERAAPPPSAAAPAPPPVKEFVETAPLKDIHFDFDKYNIRPDAADVLEANIDWMKSNADTLILIEGHCDERGTDEYNMALGDRRAKSTMNYLVAHGVAADRITTISYGEERPLCVEHNETCWAQNRRAHFLTKSR